MDEVRWKGIISVISSAVLMVDCKLTSTKLSEPIVLCSRKDKPIGVH